MDPITTAILAVLHDRSMPQAPVVPKGVEIHIWSIILGRAQEASAFLIARTAAQAAFSRTLLRRVGDVVFVI
jgi:hypothetical protein